MNPRLLVLAALVAGTAAHDVYCRCLCGLLLSVESVAACSACTRAFCAEIAPDMCSVSEDIIPSCFQTDSLKDLVVVYGFVAAVLGLAGYGVWQKGLTGA